MTPLLIVIYSICGIYLILNLKHDIHMLQQNSYRLPRYWRYVQNNDIGSTWRLADVALIFIICSRLLPVSLSAIFVGLLSIVKIYLILTRKFKKPLVFTSRVKRIYSVGSAVIVGLELWAVFMIGFDSELSFFYSGPVITLTIILLMSIFSWVIVVISLILLMPFERYNNRRYYKDASRILNNMSDLKVIGITGSYGKTSTKHYLQRILDEKYNVLITPGSYNTTLGVVRTIREMCKPFHNIFICEMGAKQKGDIKEICDLVHPNIGIVTAVGPMHLETFKTIENVGSTKFELIDSLPSDGLAIVNNDFPYCEKREVDNVKCFRYTENPSRLPDGGYLIKNINYTDVWTEFTIEGNGIELKLKTRLMGAHNVSNLAAAIIAAKNLGLTDEEIMRGVAAIEPVEHRLSRKMTPSGVTILDDAFNSNPHGSKYALDVLSKLKNGKRIVVTPGMIELGEMQNQYNEELGEEIARTTDIAIIVGEYNRDSLRRGIERVGYIEDNLYIAGSFKEAQSILEKILQPGDTILYENDLPDTFK